MSDHRRALISDIHSNLEAMEAVLAHLQTQHVGSVYCLGDIIGYGPDPVKCLDLVMQHAVLSLMGNHDQAALFDPEGFNRVALDAIYWTRDELERPNGGAEVMNRRWDYLGELPRRVDEGEFLFVHGSPRDPTNEYVFPEHAYDAERMEALFRRVDRYCFQGHTHIPGIFVEGGRFLTPADVDHVYELADDKAMINVGSVGQPRDEDPRACYAVLDYDTRRVEFHRVAYDVATTQRKIYAIDALSNTLAERLARGD
jgi:diadenosine tetraphosphatase ApaH/serine/threonine PP2A family protein phosphatase